MFEEVATTKTGPQDPNIRHSSHKKDRRGRRDISHRRGGRNFLILDQGEYDGAKGYWLQDEDTLEEGFVANDTIPPNPSLIVEAPTLHNKHSTPDRAVLRTPKSPYSRYTPNYSTQQAALVTELRSMASHQR